jgi:hypothetical protein
MEGQPENIPQQSEQSKELQEILEYFGIQGEIQKETTKGILKHAYELLNLGSQELSNQVSFEIKGKQYSLHYTLYPRKSGDVWVRVGLYETPPLAEIKDTSSFNVGEISMTRVRFNFKTGRVSGEFGTAENNEGQGYGSALLLMREGIIKDIIRRYPDKIPADGLTAEITDNSRSLNPDKQYDGISTSLAQKMGYVSSEKNKLFKIYKQSQPDQS